MSQRDTYQLTPIVTADDAKSARDRPDSAKSPVLQESDSEDDELLAVSRSTIELAQHDRGVLEDEDEMEKLLVRPGRNPDGLRRIFSSPGANQSTVRIGRPRLRSPLREDPEMIFEMEEGALGDHEDADMPSRSSIESSRAEKLIPRPYYDVSKLLIAAKDNADRLTEPIVQVPPVQSSRFGDGSHNTYNFVGSL